MCERNNPTDTKVSEEGGRAGRESLGGILHASGQAIPPFPPATVTGQHSDSAPLGVCRFFASAF